MTNDKIYFCKSYIEKFTPAVSGEFGHNHALRVCNAIFHGFGLEREEGWPIFMDYCSRCEPPFTEEEAERVYNKFVKNPPETPRGHLLKSMSEYPQYKSLRYCSMLRNASYRDVGEMIPVPEWTTQLDGTAWIAVLNHAHDWIEAGQKSLGEALDVYTGWDIEQTHSQALRTVKCHISELREYIDGFERYLRLSSEQIKREIWNEDVTEEPAQ